MNLVKKIVEQVKKRPQSQAIKYFKNGQLYSLNWVQAYNRVELYYRTLISLGVKPGDRVAIYSNTCKEWGFLDLAIMACRAVCVPVYHSSHPDDVAFILRDSDPKIVFVEDEKLYKTLSRTEWMNKDQTVIAINDFKGNFDTPPSFLKNILSQNSSEATLERASKELAQDDLATVIYTSGTSGRPKGVELTHQQITSSAADVFPLLGVTSRDSTLTFLPFSHVLGRIELWGHYFCGYCIGYAESIERIKKNIVEVQPTVIVGVPRIFEKIYFGIKAQIEISKLKQGIFNRAIKVGKKNQKLRQNKKSPSFLQALKSQVAHQMVFSQIHEKLGGRLRFAVSGGAPLDPQIADFFAACNIPILEGYGLTETTGPIFVNTLFENQNGSVGKAVGDVELKFDSDGEILVRSQKVMTGYYKNKEATDSVFTEDGFFRTGDIGELDDKGFLKITDRKKDLIKTAGGKFVAPQKLQNLFATDPLIGHVHIHGDKKKYIVALITLERDRLLQLKKQHNISVSEFDQLAKSELVQSEVRQTVARINSGLASFETIKRFKVLDHEFSIEKGQLTPSLKMKRKAIDQQYQSDIDSLY